MGKKVYRDQRKVKRKFGNVRADYKPGKSGRTGGRAFERTVGS